VLKRIGQVVLRGFTLLLVAVLSCLATMRIAIHGREVSVPSFIGMAPAEAQRVASQNGLLFTIDENLYSNDVPSDHIASQSPSPGEHVRRGWRVRVATSLGPHRVVVPNVVGESQRVATMNLHRRGIAIASVAFVPDRAVPAGQVVSQALALAPAEGMPKIRLVVSSGPERPAPELGIRRAGAAQFDNAPQHRRTVLPPASDALASAPRTPR
jgi:beta-lactam-binding protein with PASTA domain